MSAVRDAWARLLSLFRRDALDREFDEEAQSHLELAVEDYVRRGTPEAEARRLARVKFGAVEASKDAHRDARGLAWLDGIVYDVRFALRGLRRDWTFSLAAIATLTLAIGLNVTVFTVMDAMLFRGFPLVKNNNRLVYLQEHGPSGACCLLYPDFEEWRSHARSFDGMAFVGGRSITFTDGNERPIDMSTTTLSAGTFGVLGVSPLLGRDFTPADERPGAAPVAILNYRFWKGQFSKRADIVGLNVRINGASATVIGVMPERFDFPLPATDDLWMPAVRTPEVQRRTVRGGFLAVGRLRNGVSRQEARAELETIGRRLEAAYPSTNRELVPWVATHSELNSGRDAAMIWESLWVAAWFVLLIACANVANLTLVRTMGRWREFATRIALGAGQARMVRQILLESLVLAGVAGAFGWWITNWSVRTWMAVTASRYQVLDYGVDAGTLAYLAAISVLAAIAVSLTPIVRVVQLGVSGALKGDARGVTKGLRARHLGVGLVAGQMVLAIVLLSGTGVLGRSFAKIVGADTGVHDPEHILVGSITLPSDTYPTAARRLAHFNRLDARLTTIPGVEKASVATNIPVYGENSRPFEIQGKPTPPDAGERVQFLKAGSDYFRVLGDAAISGRDFNEGDQASASPVAIVNQSLAAMFWPGADPIGQHLRATDQPTPGEWLTVVGVVPNIMQGDALRQQFKPLIYLPFQQESAPRRAVFLARTNVPPDHVAQAVRAAVQQIDPDVVLEHFDTLKARFAFDRDYMDAEHSELRKHAVVATVFALIALLLAAIGLGAVIAHSVSQRTKEIGVRVALGAAARDVRRLIFGEGMRPVALGVIVGLTASLAVNRILQSQLVGVSPYDPVTLATAPAVLIVVALLACQLPSQRALRIDPADALRHE